MHYTGIVFIVLKQVLAESEERRARYTVVFKHYSLRNALEKPVKRRSYRVTAAEIRVPVQRFELAAPVDCRGNFAGGLATGCIGRDASPGTIGGHKDPGWLDGLNALEDRSGRFWAVKHQQEHRY